MSEAQPVEFMLDGYPEAIRETAMTLRSLIFRSVPGTVETIRPGWRWVAYSLPDGKRVRNYAWIGPERKHIHLGFEHGTLLADPDRILHGAEERLKKFRYLTFEPSIDVQEAVLADYLRRAAELALLPPGARRALTTAGDLDREPEDIPDDWHPDRSDDGWGAGSGRRDNERGAMSTLPSMTTAAIEIGPLHAGPGTRVTGIVPVNVGTATLEVPVAIVNGSRPGPRLAVTAGIHGAEYVSIAALREVVLRLDPASVSGSVVAVLTANPAAFAARSIYVNPMDGLNLNRQLPGDEHGSPTQRLASWLRHSIIAGSDVFVDMHCGDMNEALVSFTGIEETGDPTVDARSRELAEAYGLQYLLIGPAPGTTTTAAAALGIPAVLGEVGGQGRWPREDVELHAAGFRRLLKAAGLLEDAPSTPAYSTQVLPTEAWMRATTTGYWHPAVAVGDRIPAGAEVGEVQDAFGVVLERPVAPMAGVVIFLVSSLAMNAGDPLLALAG